jgi:VanZ family protein
MSRKDAIDLAHLGIAVSVILLFAWGQNIYPVAFTVWCVLLLGIGLAFRNWGNWIAFHFALFLLPFSTFAGTFLLLLAVMRGAVEPKKDLHGTQFISYFRFLSVILITLPLAFLSGSGGSAGGWTDQLREWFNFTPDQADIAVKLIRKTIHFCAYGTIAMTAYLATRSIQKGKSAIIVALVWGCAHGAFDELRQAQTPGRQGRIEDFMVDLAGMIVFLAVTHWLCNNRDKTVINES